VLLARTPSAPILAVEPQSGYPGCAASATG
jgi:hypothetical protein